MAKAKKEATPKRENLYKVVTTLPSNGPGTSPTERVDYVRAKTRAGAVSVAAGQFIKADIATADDMLKLANISTLNKAEG
jgi:hypothetical protein